MIDKTIHNRNLNEAATPQQVMDAIKKRYEAEITYAGDENGKGKGKRYIQPVAYGLSKAGNPVIRAFQPFGDTTTKVPHWKMFRLDKIDKWVPKRNRRFDTPPAPQWNAEGAFNPDTDKSMAEVYMIADFEGAKQRYNDNLRKHNEKRRQEKIEKDPLYVLKQNIKNSIKGDPEIMKRVAEWEREQERRKQKQQGVATSQINNAKEMASIKDFGDSSTTTTSGPISKQDTVVNKTAQPQQTEQPKQPNIEKYKTVINNGPVFKGQKQQKEEIPNTETENNLENDNEEENNG